MLLRLFDISLNLNLTHRVFMDFQSILLHFMRSQNIVLMDQNNWSQTDVGVNAVCTDYNSCVALGKVINFQVSGLSPMNSTNHCIK